MSQVLSLVQEITLQENLDWEQHLLRKRLTQVIQASDGGGGGLPGINYVQQQSPNFSKAAE